MNKEYYDPSKPVCGNQSDFNMAFNKALKQNNKEAMKKAKAWVVVSLTVWLIFFIWALMLAMQLPQGSDKTVHLVFAMAFSPVYVLAHYAGLLSDKDSVSMGMRRRYY
jgi:hypothetical protein